jgi:hypothetical protein
VQFITEQIAHDGRRDAFGIQLTLE